MLKTRVLTAVVLLVLLCSVLFFHSFTLFVLIAAVFFAAAMWENCRLFNSKYLVIAPVLWTVAFLFIIFNTYYFEVSLLFEICVMAWVVCLAPSLRIRLPPLVNISNLLLREIYNVTIFGCFVAIIVLFEHSPLYLLSVMAIVWVADIGAYFAGKIFGKHKLASYISPGKSWEGAIGGWLIALAISAATIASPALTDTFAARLHNKWGWVGFSAVMTLLVVASIIGDLFESLLKRRAGMKDSSNLLPGHGGVLDRIDALIPVLPLAVVFNSWL